MQSLCEAGFLIVRNAVTTPDVAKLRDAFARFDSSRAGGKRNVLQMPEVACLARGLRTLVEPHLGNGTFAVRGIFFDKKPGANWALGWHQDLMIAVKEAVAVGGYSSPSVKDGVPHVQPPLAVLDGMLTVRLHLDDCGAENGALLVVAGSHRYGKLTDAEIAGLVSRGGPTLVEARSGDALLIRPLLLHCSRRATSPSHRRVVHIEYAATDLGCALDWFERVS